MRAFWGLLLGLLLTVPTPGQDVTRDLVRSVLEDADCQTSLPSETEGVGGRESSAEPLAEGRERSPLFEGISSLGSGVATFLLWVFVAVVVVFLIAAFIRSQRNVAPRQRSRAGPVDYVAQDKPAAEPLPAYARLAEVGDFAGAVHAVLLHAFATCSRHIGGLPEHATARHVLRLATRSDLPTGDLRELVMAVERVHFGGALADRELYEASTQRLLAWEAACQKP